MRIEEAIAEVRKGKYLTWNGQILKPSNAISISTMLKSDTFGVEEPLAKEWVEIWNGDKPKQPMVADAPPKEVGMPWPEKLEMENKWLPVADVAMVLDVPESAAYSWIYDGKLTAYFTDELGPNRRKWKVYLSDVRAFARDVKNGKIRTKYTMPDKIGGVEV